MATTGVRDGHHSSPRVTRAGAGRRIEDSAVGLARTGGFGHRVVDRQDEALSAELAMVPFLVLAEHEERVEDVLHLWPGQAVDMEHGGVQLGTDQLATPGQPAEGW